MLDLKNVVAVMVCICDTFDLTHQDMMNLRQKIEKVYRSQPKVYARKRTSPVSLHGITLAIGLCIAFGGGKVAVGPVLKLSSHKLIDVARQYDPFEKR